MCMFACVCICVCVIVCVIVCAIICLLVCVIVCVCVSVCVQSADNITDEYIRSFCKCSQHYTAFTPMHRYRQHIFKRPLTIVGGEHHVYRWSVCPLSVHLLSVHCPLTLVLWCEISIHSAEIRMHRVTDIYHVSDNDWTVSQRQRSTSHCIIVKWKVKVNGWRDDV